MTKKKNYIISFLFSMLFGAHLLYLGKRERFVITFVAWVSIALLGVQGLTNIVVWSTLLSSFPLTYMYNEGKI